MFHRLSCLSKGVNEVRNFFAVVSLTIVTSLFVFASTYKVTATISVTNSKPISVWTYQKMLGVGIDVDWVNFKKTSEYFMNAYRRGTNVPLLFKERGFNHVRIRIGGDVVSDSELMNELKIAVNECLKANIIPIISYSASDFRKNPDSNEAFEEVVKWWTYVAKQFKGYPYLLSYDLIIETSGKIANSKYNDRLNELYQEVVSAIHKIDPYRIVFITPNDVSNPYYLQYLKIPQPSTYVMVEWHFYAAGPSKHNPRKLWTTGTFQEKQLILSKIDYAYHWSMEHHIPTWVGAWMATDYNKVNKKKRFPDGAPAGGEYTLNEEKNFARFMAESLKNKGIPYAINADNKYFDIEELKWYKSVESVLNIILNP